MIPIIFHTFMVIRTFLISTVSFLCNHLRAMKQGKSIDIQQAFMFLSVLLEGINNVVKCIQVKLRRA